MSLRKILYELPIAKIFSLYYFIRALLFTKPRPEGTIIIINTDFKTLTKLLGGLYFNGKFPLSWNYKSEDLNMRREYYDDSYDWPWRQLHIRGFITSGKFELQPHEEVSPSGEDEDTDRKISHQRAHLKGKESSAQRGVEMTEEVLTQLDVDYTVGYNE